jgi:guanylate kinase
MIAADVFLEWADVFGHHYGTSLVDTDKLLVDGHDVVLVIDVQGSRTVQGRRKAARVFVMPPSLQVLEQRLRGRKKDNEQAIQRRLKSAKTEVNSFADYDYVLVNEDLHLAVEDLRGIILAERAKLDRMRSRVETIVRTFHD